MGLYTEVKYETLRGNYPENGFPEGRLHQTGGAGIVQLKKVKILKMDSPKGDYTRREGRVFSSSKRCGSFILLKNILVCTVSNYWLELLVPAVLRSSVLLSHLVPASCIASSCNYSLALIGATMNVHPKAWSMSGWLSSARFQPTKKCHLHLF